LRLGRDFTEHDKANSPLVALVNEAFAQRYFPGGAALGRHFTFPGSTAFKTTSRTVEIVGVVGDTHYAELRGKTGPIALVPFAQSALNFGRATFIVRTRGSSGGLTGTIRRLVRETDPSLAVDDLSTQEEQVNRLYARERIFAVLGILFGALALTLACIGLYGVLAHDVTARTREIGIRMALGAQTHEILGMVMRSGLGFALLGCLLGVLGSFACSRLIAQFLFEITPLDPRTFLAASMVLLVMTGIACWLPARRAAEVDPVVALRAE
jgi:predicted permease